MKRKFDHDLATKRYVSGETATAIARDYGVSEEAIRYAARMQGHVRGRTVRKFDHEEAVRRYVAGETVAAIARDYGVSENAVSRVVRQQGVTRPQAQAHRFDHDRAVEMYLEGHSAMEVGRRLGVSGRSVLKVVGDRGVARPPGESGPRKHKFDHRHALRLYEGGWSYAMIARQLGVSFTAVQKVVQAAGIARPRGVSE
jgi:transposase-like protein